MCHVFVITFAHVHLFRKESLKIPKGVIRICKSRENRQPNSQKKKDKQRSTKNVHKTKDRATRTPLKAGGELG